MQGIAEATAEAVRQLALDRGREEREGIVDIDEERQVILEELCQCPPALASE